MLGNTQGKGGESLFSIIKPHREDIMPKFTVSIYINNNLSFSLY